MTVAVALTAATISIAVTEPQQAIAQQEQERFSAGAQSVSRSEGGVAEKKLRVIDKLTDPAAQSVVPQEAYDGLEALNEGGGVSVDHAMWENDTLIVYVSDDLASAELATKSSSLFDSVAHEFRRSVNSKSTVQALMMELISDGTLNRPESFVAEVTSSPDGSTIFVGVTGESTSVAVQSRFSGRQNGPSIVVEIVDPSVQATRIRTSAPVASGQYILDGNVACTNGFWLKNPFGLRATLTADHCGRAVGSKWYFGPDTAETRVLGTAQGQAPGGSDLELFIAPGDKGLSLATSYILIGNFTNTTSVTSIRGLSEATIIGDTVCYSGSRSGLICQNVVTSVDGVVCYQALQCYTHVTRTTQAQSVPAAGLGDSGGPAITVRNGGYAYAAGVISGVSNANQTCTGDSAASRAPGEDRVCSKEVILAEPSAFFDADFDWELVYSPITP